MTNEAPSGEGFQSRQRLQIVGGIAALVAAIVFRRWLSAEYGLLRAIGLIPGGPAPNPSTAADWYRLLHEHSLVGVLLLNATDLINYGLVGLIFLGLAAALWRRARRAAVVSAFLAIVGVAFFFLSNQAFPLLSLSREYYAATTDLDRGVLLSAGEALITTSNPLVFATGVFWAFVLVTTAGVVASSAMLRTGVFSKATGWTGLVANILGLGYFLTVAVDPPLTAIPMSLSAPFLLVWYILTGIGLLKISRADKDMKGAEGQRRRQNG